MIIQLEKNLEWVSTVGLWRDYVLLSLSAFEINGKVIKGYWGYARRFV
jgi:hypothetical protein